MSRLTLGAQLRIISDDAKSTNVEMNNIFELCKAQALLGENSIKIDDLRKIAPNMIQRETLFTRLDAEEIKASGMVNPSTAAWEYTLSW